MLSPCDDEIDLREVFAAIRRRWRWVLGGGFLGLALAAGLITIKRSEAPLLRASLVVDTAQSPCRSVSRNAKSYPDTSSLQSTCDGEYQTTRLALSQFARNKFEPLAKKYRQLRYIVAPLSFDVNGGDKSTTQLALNLTLPDELRSEVAAILAQIKQKMDVEGVGEYSNNNSNLELAAGWVVVKDPSEIDAVDPSFRLLALGLLGGLVVGAGSALIADRRSNRVYSRDELLRRLKYPLRLSLPAGPWTASAVEVLVGQLATQLDQNLSWRVLSIARQHEAVDPLTQILQQQGGTELQCNSADPLLAAVLRMESSDRPTGLLLVVEPGFNSARALEEARLLISQMGSVQAVGVVLIGAPLPEELSS